MLLAGAFNTQRTSAHWFFTFDIENYCSYILLLKKIGGNKTI